jgi:hypothetical protein
LPLAKRLRRQKPKGGRMSLRKISAELAAQGFLNENGRSFAAASIKSMLKLSYIVHPGHLAFAD